MNLTKDIDTRIKDLFEGMIMVNSHENYLNTIINKNIDSYYEVPQHPAQAYFSFIDTTSVANLTGYLNDFWMELGSEEFTSMVGELSELAFMMSADHQSQSEDVSPFVYTMY